MRTHGGVPLTFFKVLLCDFSVLIQTKASTMDKSGMKLVLNQGDENDNNGGWSDGSV